MSGFFEMKEVKIMRVKVKSIKRICIVLGIISLFLCAFVFIKNSIAKSKAIDFINETIYYKVNIKGDLTEEQKQNIEASLKKISKIDKYEKSDNSFNVHVKINNVGDINEDYFISLQNILSKIENVENVETNFDKVLKYYGIYGYKDFIKEYKNS